MHFKSSLLSLSFIFCLLFLVSCGPSAEERKNEISNTEKTLKNADGTLPDSASVANAIAQYTEFVKSFPEDSLSPIYLFRGANLAAQKGDLALAISLLDQLHHDYPKHAEAPKALFLKGFVSETQMGDFKTAEACYREFLKSYPNHELAGDVSFSLENLGKSPEQLLQEISPGDTTASK